MPLKNRQYETKTYPALKSILLLLFILTGAAAFSQEDTGPHTWKEFIDTIKEGSENLKGADFKLIIDGKPVDETDIPFEPLLTTQMSVVRTESSKENPDRPVFTIEVTTTENPVIKDAFSTQESKE